MADVEQKIEQGESTPSKAVIFPSAETGSQNPTSFVQSERVKNADSIHPIAEFIHREWRVITSVSFWIAVVLVGMGIFFVVNWHFNGDIEELNATIGKKDASIAQKDETVRTISEERDSVNRENDRLQHENDWLKNYRTQDSNHLKQDALILANEIHEYIKGWKDSDDPGTQYHNVQTYVERFGLRASLIRDDLDKAGQDSKDFDTIMWNFQSSYREVRIIADSIRKLAENLPDSSN